MADPDALRTRFAAALTGARGGADGPDPLPYADDLLARWGEPWRRYHTLAHLTAVLDHLDGALAGHAADPDAVLLAAWFHDAVYRPERDGNEERSARLAGRALAEAGVPAERAAEVARLVRLTTGHDPAADDPDGQALCDADLAILAAPPSAYAAYTAAVREEYAFVPQEDFRNGRAEVLRGLLALPALFRTPYGTEHWERTARYNINAEIDLLAAAASQGTRP
ncbi:hypothetical protein ABZX40_10060 [Streptomyces sp. NPDC004610]|uniref:HD domain-containing protein n=1 Tax=unclassified Streptomyces TaxID=2593676 RepID=UPI0033ACB476